MTTQHVSTMTTLLKLANEKDQANQKPQAARFYRMAGEKAAAQYESSQAIAHFTKALSMMDEGMLTERFYIITQREQLFANLGNGEARNDDLVTLAMLADALDDDQKQVQVAARLADAKLESGAFQDAVSIARLAIRLAKAAGATLSETRLNIVWGRASQRLGQTEMAKRKLKGALKMATTAVYPIEQAKSLHALGVVYEENGRFAQATTSYEEALQLYKAHNHLPGMGSVLTNLGNTAYNQRHFGKAVAYWDEASPILTRLGDQSGNVRLMLNQSNACMDMGQYEMAQSYTEKALVASQELGVRFAECVANITLGLANHYQANREAALMYAETAVNIATQMGSRRMEGYALNTLGHAQFGLGQAEKASEAYWSALAIWHEMDQAAFQVEAQSGLLAIAIEAGDEATVAEFLTDIMRHLEEDAALDGIESPFRVYWTTYRALVMTKDLRAVTFLHQAHERLMMIADTISDDVTRHAFLTQVAVNQSIRAAFGETAVA